MIPEMRIITSNIYQRIILWSEFNVVLAARLLGIILKSQITFSYILYNE